MHRVRLLVVATVAAAMLVGVPAPASAQGYEGWIWDYDPLTAGWWWCEWYGSEYWCWSPDSEQWVPSSPGWHLPEGANMCGIAPDATWYGEPC